MSENINSYVVYSPNESAVMDGAGFWSNEFGWTTFDQATRFSQQDTQTMSLPVSTGADAKWVLWEEANASYGAPVSETVTVRLTLDVTYSLNGENATEMVSRLRKMCERAIGEGMLTGETDAEVEEYSMAAVIQPGPLSEDELAGFMLQRIENGDLALEDIPVRLARYGLMEPNAFVDEMRERMELAKAETHSWAVTLTMENGTKFDWTGEADDQDHAEGQAIAEAVAKTRVQVLDVVHANKC